MSSVYNRGTRSKPRWYIRFKGPDGKHVSRPSGKATKAEAKRWAALVEADIEAGGDGLGHLSQDRAVVERRTFAHLAEHWLENYSEAHCRSHSDNAQRLKTHLLPTLGEIALATLTAQHVEEFIAAKRREKAARTGKVFSPQTVNHLLKLVKQILNAGVRWGWLNVNVAQPITPLPVPEKARSVLSPEEVRRLVAAAPPALEPVFVMAVHTGCRRGELFGLRWADLDLASGWISVSRSYGQPTKNNKIKGIPMTPELRERLRRWRLEWGSVSGTDRPPGPSDYVFPVPGRGGARRSKGSKYGLRQRMETATGGRVSRFHSLRHTAATLMVQAGIDLSTVQEVLGHSSIRITERYRHLRDDFKQQQMGKLSLVPAGVATGQTTRDDASAPGEHPEPAAASRRR